MNDTVKSGIAGFGIVITSVAAIFIVGLLGFGMYAFFAPKYMAVDNKVFHESQQYNDRMNQSLGDYYEAYNDPNATSASKDVIVGRIRADYNRYPITSIEDPTLRTWLQSIRGY
jgi:hypothetical protein